MRFTVSNRVLPRDLVIATIVVVFFLFGWQVLVTVRRSVCISLCRCLHDLHIADSTNSLVFYYFTLA